MSEITEATIRERLATDKRKPSRLATWAEIEFLLGLLDQYRADSVILHGRHVPHCNWRCRPAVHYLNDDYVEMEHEHNRALSGECEACD